jgi:hypothetical protein
LFQSAIEASQNSWFAYEPFTLLSIYKTLQRNFIKVYSPYEYLVKNYRNTTKRQVYPITEEYLNSNKIAEENIVLLKNAIELWRSASQTTDQIAPLLFHYSWHCFNSFFAYTFFRWEPQHASSHGIEIRSESITDEIGKIALRFGKERKSRIEKGLFQRLIDTWTLLGGSPAFGEYLPIFQEGKISYFPNEFYLLKESRCLELSKLLDINPNEYFGKYSKIFGKNLVHNNSFYNSTGMPTSILKSYLVLFVASSIARYRPILWDSILSGETQDKADFALVYRDALLKFSQFGINSLSFLYRFKDLVFDIMKGKFELKQLP